MSEHEPYGPYHIPLKISRARDPYRGENWLRFLHTMPKPPFLNHGKAAWVPGGEYYTPPERSFVVQTWSWWDPDSVEQWRPIAWCLTLEEARDYCRMIREKERFDKMGDGYHG